MLRYINDTYRTLYAFEMMPPPQTEDVTQDEVTMGTSNTVGTNNMAPQPINNATDIFTNVGVFDSSRIHDAAVTNNQLVATPSENKEPQILNNLGDGLNHTWLEAGGFMSGVDWTDNLSKPVNTAKWTDVKTGDQSDRNTESGDVISSGVDEGCDAGEESGGCLTDQWQSCAICLEEMADNDLLAHAACGGTLCQSCLEVCIL